MTLTEMLVQTKNLSDSVIVLEFNNEFYVGCEKAVDDSKFALLNGEKKGFDMIYESNSRLVSNRNPARFSQEARTTLTNFIKTMNDPFGLIIKELSQIYEKVLEPVKLETVRKRDLKNDLICIGMTLTYPISAPASYLALMAYSKSENGNHTKGKEIAREILSAPIFFPTSVKDILFSSAIGMKVANQEIFSRTPENEYSVAIMQYDEFNLNLFAKKSYLSPMFSNGIELHNGWLSQHECIDQYSESHYFLKSNKETFERVISLAKRKNELDNEWTNFEKAITYEELKKILAN